MPDKRNLLPYTVVAGYYDDGATYIAHVDATGPEHAAELTQLKVHAEKLAAGDILDSELGPIIPGEVLEILYMVAIFPGHHTNLYTPPVED